MPDREAAELNGRKALCESLAVACSLAAEREDVPMIRNVVRSVVGRNAEVISAAARKADGELLVTAGDHARHWKSRAGAVSTPTDMHVPIALGKTPWGSIEVRFRPLSRFPWLALIGGPLLPLAGFVGSVGAFTYYLFLRAAFRPTRRGQGGLVPGRVRDTLNTVMEGVLVLDTDQRIALANDAFARTVGVPAESLRGRRASELCRVGTRQGPVSEALPWTRAIADGVPQRGSILRINAGREASRGVKVSVNSTSIFGDDGVCRGALATFDDLTPVEDRNAKLRGLLKRLKLAQARTRRQKIQLRKARDDAEAASRAKSEFLANVSHEIRTPMNAILGMTEAALDASPSPEQRECLDIVKESADSLLSVINDILDLGKIESGKFELDPAPFQLREVVNGVLKTLTFRARQKGLQLSCEIDSNIPDRLVGDDTRLRQILINLVGNAVKFTETGGVVIAVKIDRQNSPDLSLHFTVSDTGIGIPDEKLRSIFDPFTQADSSITRRYGGTGLGLTICARLVGMMSGRIWVESEPRHGSDFHFTAQFERDQSLPVHNIRTSALSLEPTSGRLRVLLVDDNIFNQKVGAGKLAKMGHHVTVVSGGTAALAAAENVHFDLIFMDLHMKDMDGLEATQRFRLREANTGHRTPIIAMTARAMKEDRDLCLASGMDGFLSKPVRDADLLKAIRAAVPNPPIEFPKPVAITRALPEHHPERWLAKVDGDTQLLDELVTAFQTDCPPLMTEIEDAIRQGRPDDLRRPAHTLKSMLLFFETSAADAAARLELMGRESDLTAASETFRSLSTDVDRFLRALVTFRRPRPS